MRHRRPDGGALRAEDPLAQDVCLPAVLSELSQAVKVHLTVYAHRCCESRPAELRTSSRGLWSGGADPGGLAATLGYGG
jgi:hypothetical protein